MRYTGNICDGCKKPFTDTDDVVVCPECATPQHRECYDEKGECVNAQLHSEGFQWKCNPEVKTETKTNTPEAEEKTLTCPNCKQENPADSEMCQHCGMKFVVFGKNLAQVIEKLESEEKTIASEADENFKGPYPAEDKTLGVPTNTLGVFMRGNADYYIRKFKVGQGKSFFGFNFAAFLFAPYWFFYRKLYKPGIIFLTASLGISILMTPSYLEFMEVMETVRASLGSSPTYEAIETALMPYMATLTEQAELILTLGFALLSLHLTAGFTANRLYRGYVLSAMSINRKLKSRQERVNFFTKCGGVSWLMVLVCYFAKQLLATVAGMLMA